MRTISIQQAKKHLSRLVDAAAKGESFLISSSGKPVVKVIAFVAPGHGQLKRLGFLEGQFAIPEDFDRMGSSEIERDFGVSD
ncbi:type II toxin-antitoxin system Phd/YefM family antitoxin [Pseudomonas sp. LT1P18]|uniref:type II toxin-antitoxin system Phd/YefM family antitoxin n=1 Tax=Pseudomonas arabinosi TaxID=3398357 RepID=UPI0039EF3171